MSKGGHTIAESLADVRAKVSRAAAGAGRKAEEVTVLAVTKEVSVEGIAEAFEADQRVFGENYVQEASAKISELHALGITPQFHLIGPLQRNKAGHAVALFELIHSVDRLSLAEEIAKRAAQSGKVQRALIQVNISGEKTKSGISPGELCAFFKQAVTHPSIRWEGLMCIGTYAELGSPNAAQRKEYELMASLRSQVEKEFGIWFPCLSMGMSNDYELAIECGATIVRVGTAIFGERKNTVQELLL